MKVGVVMFPGSNCDQDAFDVSAQIMGWDTRYLWHKESSVGDVDAVILPGGFSYGDYLRGGAIARFSPIMNDVIRFANDGGTLIGICNGFQILTEAGLLPGVLMRNASVKFVCRDVFVRVASNSSPLTGDVKVGTVLRIPVAHGEGNYYADAETLDRLAEKGQIIFEYCNADGELTDDANPNGSQRNIAGVANEAGNVIGMMPHPERCSEALLGNTDGKQLFEALGAKLGQAA